MGKVRNEVPIVVMLLAYAEFSLILGVDHDGNYFSGGETAYVIVKTYRWLL